MPNCENDISLEAEKKRLAIEISNKAVLLTGNEKRVVAVRMKVSDDTIYNYSKGKVKKIAVAQIMLVEMEKVMSERNNVPTI
jgi:hypothetical protein